MTIRFLFRYIISFFAMIILLLPTFLIPRRFLFSFFYPMLIRLFLFAPKVKTVNLTDSGCVPGKKPVIYVSNHKAYTDPMVMARYAHTPFTFVIKKEMLANFFFWFVVWKMALIPLDRDNVISQKKAFDKINKYVCKKNYSLIFFPEGRYNFGAKIGEIKPGIAKIARDTGAEVIPIALYGIEDRELFHSHKRLHRSTTYYKAGNPLSYSDYRNDEEFIKSIKENILTLYDEIRHTITEE